jgi:hypothetical protein
MRTFKIVFKNSSKKLFKLSFKVYDNNISYKWFNALIEQAEHNSNIYEPDRFYGFPSNEWNEEKIVNKLNACIDCLNTPKIMIEHRAYVGMSQENLNHLHHYFENLRGGINSPAEFWLNSSTTAKKVLEQYNVLIHRAEDFYSQKNLNLEPRVVCTFQNKKRYELSDDDYKNFTLVKNFGEVYINYCEVGKSLYDLYRDNDDVIGEDNIRPLRCYSADFKIHFHTTTQQHADNILNKMNKWWHTNHNYLSSLGFYQNNPKNSIGNIPVAKIVDCDLTNNDIIYKLCDYNFIKNIEL